MFLTATSRITEVLVNELEKIAEAYAFYGLILVICLMILGLIIRGVKSFFRRIFKK